jgi:hypothetical protein
LLAAVRHRKGEGIAAIGAAEERTTLTRERRVEPVRIERHGLDRALEQAQRAVAQTDRRPAMPVMSPQARPRGSWR